MSLEEAVAHGEPTQEQAPSRDLAVGRSHAGAGAECEVEGAAGTEHYKLTSSFFPIPLQHLQREEVG